METEHHEIAVYEALITLAHGQGQGEVAGRWRANLGQERHSLEEVGEALERLAHHHAPPSAH